MNTIENPADSSSDLSQASQKSIPTITVDPYYRVIKPSRGWIAIDWRELYLSRELFDTLIMRDIKIRYKQTVLGIAWAVVQPLVSMVLFTLIFGKIQGVKPDGVPYQLFVFAGMVPWTFFTNAVSGSSMSLISQHQLLTKIYFPRLYLPASTAGAYLVDMAVGLLLFGILMPLYLYAPTYKLIFLPLAVVFTFVAALGGGLTLASMTILYRDLRFIIPFMLQLLMFSSPIFYQLNMLPRYVQLILAVNPMTGIIGAFRWTILGLPIDIPILLISLMSSILSLIFGLFFFRKSERFFADLL